VSRFIITEGKPLKGSVRVSGAKNSVLPIIAATLLADGQCTLEEIPYLNDVRIMCELLQCLGAKVDLQENDTKLEIYGQNISISII
jgi:UDP-N-acetylglucosamine 1-carboxyvinyltransferase